MVLTIAERIMSSYRVLKAKACWNLVEDNGRGMTVEKLASLQVKLAQRSFEHEAKHSGER